VGEVYTPPQEPGNVAISITDSLPNNARRSVTLFDHYRTSSYSQGTLEMLEVAATEVTLAELKQPLAFAVKVYQQQFVITTKTQQPQSLFTVSDMQLVACPETTSSGFQLTG